MAGEVDEKSSITQSFKQLESQQDAQPAGKIACLQLVPKRYVLAIMAFLGFANVYALRVNMSIAIVAMTANYTIDVNGTQKHVVDFAWDSQTKGLVLAAFFWGYLITQMPGGLLSKRYGGKILFGGGILATGALTMITPPVARISVYLLIFLRILEGLFEGVTYPAIHAMWSKWAPPLERSKLATIAFSGSYFGTVISMPLSGVIADSIGWPWIFYLFGLLAIVWFVCWFLVVTDGPENHDTISQDELEFIQQTTGFTDSRIQARKIPWKEIFMSLPVWAIIVAHSCETWGFYTMLTELPTFLGDVMHYNLYKAGFVCAIPYLAMTITVMLGGHFADVIRSRGLLSTTTTRKIFNCAAFLAQTVFMVAAGYTQNATAAIACLTLAVGLGGFAFSGFSVNHLDIAPHFAALLMGISNTVATLSGVITPVLTGYIVQDSTADEWRIVFYIAGIIYCAGAIFYGIFASGEKQTWAELPPAYEPQLDHAEDEE